MSLYLPYFFIVVIEISSFPKISFFISDKSVSEEIINLQTLDLLKARYNLSFDLDDDWVLPVFDHIARVRAIKKLRGETDYDRVIEVLFNDIFDGSIGRITWEDVSCVND